MPDVTEPMSSPGRTGPQAVLRALDDSEDPLGVTELAQQTELTLSDEEPNPGVRAIAVPVLHDGTAVAAIAVQGPTIRLTEDRLDDIAAQLRSTAQTVAPGLSPSSSST